MSHLSPRAIRVAHILALAGSPMTAAELAEAMWCHWSTAKGAVRELVRAGVVVAEPGGTQAWVHGRRPDTYRLTP